MWWHMATQGRWSEGKSGEWIGKPVLFTLPRNMVYPAILRLMRTTRLPVVDWANEPADSNGLVPFAEWRNLISARMPSHFNRPLRLTPLLSVLHRTWRQTTKQGEAQQLHCTAHVCDHCCWLWGCKRFISAGNVCRLMWELAISLFFRSCLQR